MSTFPTPDPRTVLSQDELDSARENVENAPPLSREQLRVVSHVLSPQLRNLLGF